MSRHPKYKIETDGESLGDKVGKIFNTLKDAGERISQAWEEGAIEFDTFSSIENRTLDFDLLEDDIKKINRRLEQDGFYVLGSRLLLDDKQELMEIKTYSKKGEKSFVNTARAKITRVTNIPPDILEELKNKGRVELSLKFDD